VTTLTSAAEPADDDLDRLTVDLRALHTGRWVAAPVPSDATRRLIARRRLAQQIEDARRAQHQAGRRELDDALARIVSAAPSTLPVRLPKRIHSLWDPTLELDPYWSPTPVLGFRAWAMGTRLEGARRAWTTPTYEAGCVTQGKERFDEMVPHTDGSCGKPPCGIYATKEPEPLLAEFRSHRMAYGVVAMSGRVVEHDHGYRARRATAVFMVVGHGSRLITVEGREDLVTLFDDPLGYLGTRRDPTPPGPLRPCPEYAIVRALRDAAGRLGMEVA